jgi:hypothetical protein
MIAWLREHWQLRGRTAELARWHAGHRTGQRAAPVPKLLLVSYRASEINEALNLHDRVRELEAWNVYESAEDRRWWRNAAHLHD